MMRVRMPLRGASRTLDRHDDGSETARSRPVECSVSTGAAVPAIPKPRDTDAMLAAGKTIGEVCQTLEVSEPTFHRWRNRAPTR